MNIFPQTYVRIGFTIAKGIFFKCINLNVQAKN